jgi:ppGpp synthetase/RelA/SpoT-type nucleotidyltranferase
MKVPSSIRNLFNERKPHYDELSTSVAKKVNNFKRKEWHYIARVKELESFALKIETGRCRQPQNMEDFFACTIVVENLSSITEAEMLVCNIFEKHGRRPLTDDNTNKQSHSFVFDDLRLYVKWRDDEDVKPTGLNGTLFEVQIKTFLQHAWSIATHDLVYKTDKKDWSKERLAFQIKAMLEHAEISIQEAETLAKSSSLRKTDQLSNEVMSAITFINELWPSSALPKDMKRLAENINSLVHAVGIGLPELKHAIETETKIGKGTETLNLSPYAIVLQTLFNQMQEKFIEYLTGDDKQFKIYLHQELELPDSIDHALLKNAVLCNLGSRGDTSSIPTRQIEDTD